MLAVLGTANDALNAVYVGSTPGFGLQISGGFTSGMTDYTTSFYKAWKDGCISLVPCRSMLDPNIQSFLLLWLLEYSVDLSVKYSIKMTNMHKFKWFMLVMVFSWFCAASIQIKHAFCHIQNIYFIFFFK